MTQHHFSAFYRLSLCSFLLFQRLIIKERESQKKKCFTFSALICCVSSVVLRSTLDVQCCSGETLVLSWESNKRTSGGFSSRIASDQREWGNKGLVQEQLSLICFITTIWTTEPQGYRGVSMVTCVFCVLVCSSLRKMALRQSSLLILALPGPSRGTAYQEQSTPLKVRVSTTGGSHLCPHPPSSFLSVLFFWTLFCTVLFKNPFFLIFLFIVFLFLTLPNTPLSVCTRSSFSHQFYLLQLFICMPWHHSLLLLSFTLLLGQSQNKYCIWSWNEECV